MTEEEKKIVDRADKRRVMWQVIWMIVGFPLRVVLAPLYFLALFLSSGLDSVRDAAIFTGWFVIFGVVPGGIV